MCWLVRKKFFSSDSLCWQHHLPNTDNLSRNAFASTGREDLAKQTKAFLPGSRQVPSREPAPQNKSIREEEDGMEYLDKEVDRLSCSCLVFVPKFSSVLTFSCDNGGHSLKVSQDTCKAMRLKASGLAWNWLWCCVPLLSLPVLRTLTGDYSQPHPLLRRQPHCLPMDMFCLCSCEVRELQSQKCTPPPPPPRHGSSSLYTRPHGIRKQHAAWTMEKFHLLLLLLLLCSVCTHCLATIVSICCAASRRRNVTPCAQGVSSTLQVTFVFSSCAVAAVEVQRGPARGGGAAAAAVVPARARRAHSETRG